MKQFDSHDRLILEIAAKHIDRRGERASLVAKRRSEVCRAAGLRYGMEIWQEVRLTIEALIEAGYVSNG